MPQLSELEKFVLDQILPKMQSQNTFYLYELVRETLNHKDVSSFPDELVTETGDAINTYMTENSLLRELKEKRCYNLTEQGKNFFKPSV